MDFLVHKRAEPCEPQWAIEFLIDGDRAVEHAKRFETNGVYAAASYMDHVLVDFRESKDPSKMRIFSRTIFTSSLASNSAQQLSGREPFKTRRLLWLHETPSQLSSETSKVSVASS